MADSVAVLSVADMLEEVCRAAPELVNVPQPRTYRRRAEPGAVFPYIVWKTTTGTPVGAGYFNGQAGWTATEDFGCWAANLDDAQVLFTAFANLFHRRRHPVTDWLAIQASVEYVTDQEDPNGSGWQVWGRLRLKLVQI